MKKTLLARIALTLCLVLGMCNLPVNEMQVQADEFTTVQGTVLKGTTASLLLLATPQGDMEIKIDSNADTTGCKLLLVGKKVYATVYYSSADKYMHASKIASSGVATSASVDTSKQTTITAVIKDNSTDDILYVTTPQGDMELKLDGNTDYSGTVVLVAGNTYSIVCARGDDAYMHALKISDTSATVVSGVSATGINSVMTASGGVVTGTPVSGTVSVNTKADILYLNTSGGEMQFKLDNDTYSFNGLAHIPGRTLNVYYTNGSDGYLHATYITGGARFNSGATIDTSKISKVTGTVKEKTTENILYLSTQYGEMELKLDSLTTVTNCKGLVVGQRITVECSRGTDAYMHVISITG